MTVFNDIIKTNAENSNKKVIAAKLYGRQRIISFEYDLETALLTGDTIEGVKLPKNCLVIDAAIKCPNMGATGQFSLGIAQDETENLTGLIPLADAGGQAVLERSGADSDLIGTYLGDENNYIKLEVLEDTVATTGKIQGFITVAVD